MMLPVFVVILRKAGSRNGILSLTVLILLLQFYCYYELTYKYFSSIHWKWKLIWIFQRQSTGWWWHYFETHFRLASYLFGVITGYIMYNEEISRKIETKLNENNKLYLWICWSGCIGFLWFHTFQVPSVQFSTNFLNIYLSVERELWACSICWIIFACHRLKSGGVIRTVLSHPSWQPLSKLSLSMYLLHMPYLLYTAEYYGNVRGFLWLAHLHAGDIFISIGAAAFGYVLVEAPVGKVVDATCKLLSFERKTDEVERPKIKYQLLWLELWISKINKNL